MYLRNQRYVTRQIARRGERNNNKMNESENEVEIQEIEVEAEVHKRSKTKKRSSNPRRGANTLGRRYEGGIGGRTGVSSRLRNSDELNQVREETDSELNFIRAETDGVNVVRGNTGRHSRRGRGRKATGGVVHAKMDCESNQVREETDGRKRKRTGKSREDMGKRKRGRVSGGPRSGGPGIRQNSPMPVEERSDNELNSAGSNDDSDSVYAIDEEGRNFPQEKKRMEDEIEIEKRKLGKERKQMEEQRNKLFEKLFDLVSKPSGSNSTRLESIPAFDPEKSKITARQWLEMLEQFSQANNWTEPNLIYHMQSRLRGSAKAWYDSLDNYLKSWEEWKRELEENFPSEQDLSVCLREIMNRNKRKDESYKDYYFDKIRLLRPCKLLAEQAVNFIIDGFEYESIKHSARVYNYQNPEELLRQFILKMRQTPIKKEKTDRECFKCGKKGHLKKDCWKQKRENYDNNKGNQKRRKFESSRNNSKDGENSSRSKPSSNNERENEVRCEKCLLFHHTEDCKTCKTPTDNDKNVTCFNCNEKGHRVIHCDQKKLECYNCHGFGHRAKDCDKPKKNESSNNQRKANVKVTKLRADGEQGNTECRI